MDAVGIKFSYREELIRKLGNQDMQFEIITWASVQLV